MSEINKINLNNTLFDLEDTIAREGVDGIKANVANDLDACSLVSKEDKSIAGAYAVQQLNDSLKWKLHGTYENKKVTEISDNVSIAVLNNDEILKSASSILIDFGDHRLGQIELTSVDNNTVYGSSTVYVNQTYNISVSVHWYKVEGRISLICNSNGWGLNAVPVYIRRLYYR